MSIFNRSIPIKAIGKRFLALSCLACVLPLSSCFEPKEKPVPPLDLSKAIVKETPAKKADVSLKIGQVNRMPLGNLYQLTQNNAALVFDVRPTLFYKMGKIPSALSWPLTAFEKDFKKHEARLKTAKNQSTPIVVYCTDLACPDAYSFASKLILKGYDVSILEGGYEAWKIATQ